MTTTTTTCGAALAGLLEERGVDVVFGIPGVHTLEIYRGLAASGIRHVVPRHEQGAGFMADGYGRVADRARRLRGDLRARRDERAHAARPGAPRRARPARAVRARCAARRAAAGSASSTTCPTSWPSRVRSPATRPRWRRLPTSSRPSRRPGRRWRAPTGCPGPPTSRSRWTCWASRLPHPPRRRRPRHDASPPPRTCSGRRSCSPAPPGRPSCSAAARAARATRPSGWRIASPRRSASRSTARGPSTPRHPLVVASRMTFAPADRLFLDADVVLAVGTQLSELDWWALDAPFAPAGALIRVDLDPDAMAAGPEPAVSIVADAERTLAALADAVAIARGPDRRQRARSGGRGAARPAAAGRDRRAPAARARAGRGAARRPHRRRRLDAAGLHGEPRAGRRAPRLVAQPHRLRLPRLRAADGGRREARRAGAAGARAGRRRRRPVHDPGARHGARPGLPLPLVVWNNDGYGEIRDSMAATGIPPLGTDASAADFVRIAEGFGCRGVRAQTVDHVAELVREALAADRPTLIEAGPWTAGAQWLGAGPSRPAIPTRSRRRSTSWRRAATRSTRASPAPSRPSSPSRTTPASPGTATSPRGRPSAARSSASTTARGPRPRRRPACSSSSGRSRTTPTPGRTSPAAATRSAASRAASRARSPGSSPHTSARAGCRWSASSHRRSRSRRPACSSTGSWRWSSSSGSPTSAPSRPRPRACWSTAIRRCRPTTRAAGGASTPRRLAAALRRIGREGARAMQEGPLADAVVRAAAATGGILTAADLAGYRPRVVEEEPARYRGALVATAEDDVGHELLGILGHAGLDRLAPGLGRRAARARGGLRARVRRRARVGRRPGRGSPTARGACAARSGRRRGRR